MAEIDEEEEPRSGDAMIRPCSDHVSVRDTETDGQTDTQSDRDRKRFCNRQTNRQRRAL